MAKLIILSIVIMSFVIPISQSTAPKSRSTLRRVQTIILAYILIWAFMCLHWYPDIVELK
jgi:hypothetical protein